MVFGRLEAAKGLPYLVQAFAALCHKHAVLLLAGTGTEWERLERLVSELGLADRVCFAGYVPVKEPSLLCNCLDICITFDNDAL
ncbi:MAG: glycosyltransferase [Acidobacteria bacterium]|nr:MAG: glycosyltransferase [Acidobacteriota bacterium]